jgi:hypothetical protein
MNAEKNKKIRVFCVFPRPICLRVRFLSTRTKTDLLKIFSAKIRETRVQKDLRNAFLKT